MALSVCVLSKREVGRLVHHGLQPCHKEHKHVSVREAAELITGDTYREVEGEGKYITEQDSNNRRWRGRPSGGMQVLQLVRVP